MFRVPCRIAPLNKGLDTSLFQTADFAEFIRSHFDDASNSEIQLEVQFDSTFQPPLAAGQAAIDGDLHLAMHALTNNPPHEPIGALGLLVGFAHKSDDQMFGLMFDQGIAQFPGDPGASLPREGAAVFVDSIARKRSAADFAAECRFTSVHELGHAFNLAHAPQDSPTFMSRSALNSSAYSNEAYFFLEDQENLLAKCSTDSLVRPGGSAFTNQDGANEGSAATARRLDDLKLSIDVRPKECTRFEPIHLDVTLSVAGHRKTGALVPRMVDPSHGAFRVYITDPDGSERRYLNSAHCCSTSRRLKISKTEPFRRDIVLLAEQGHFTFPAPGTYGVRVEFDVGRGRRLHSNRAGITILGKEKGPWARDVLLLQRPNMLRLLQYRRAADDRVLDGMSQMIRSWRGVWDERKCLIAYRWALAVLEGRGPDTPIERSMTAVKYLEKCRHLRPHRESRAAALVASVHP